MDCYSILIIYHETQEHNIISLIPNNNLGRSLKRFVLDSLLLGIAQILINSYFTNQTCFQNYHSSYFCLYNNVIVAIITFWDQEEDQECDPELLDSDIKGESLNLFDEELDAKVSLWPLTKFVEEIWDKSYSSRLFWSLSSVLLLIDREAYVIKYLPRTSSFKMIFPLRWCVFLVCLFFVFMVIWHVQRKYA